MHDYMNRMSDVWRTCNKLRAAAFRVGLNLWDWYRPLDPDQNSLISESKFVSVLAGPLRSAVGLTQNEIAQLADYFRAPDGRVLYHQLCQLIHGEDNNALGRTTADCLLEACPPPPEPACHTLDKWQLRRLCCLLATIAERELPLRPYFQDYELVAKNDGRITFAHFARILNYIGIRVAPEDFNLLVRRFIKDSYTLDYVEFLKSVEAVKKEGIQGLGPEYQNPKAVIDTTPPKLNRPEVDAGLSTKPLGVTEVFHPVLQQPRPDRGLVEVMLRVQQYIKQNRIRVYEFFRDYDHLNSGRVAPENFRRVLNLVGLNKIISDNEVICIMRHYLDPNDGQRICWRTFEDDCDQVFTIKELEKHPTVTPGGAAAAVDTLPLVGSAEEYGEPSAADVDAAEAALLRLRVACSERSIDLRPAFRDHDQLNNGHVSRSALRRVLARLGVLPPRTHVSALEYRYLDDLGFNYFQLLEELDAPAPESSQPKKMPSIVSQRKKEVDPLETDIVQILAKIKGKMVREGVRPYQFLRQFDSHNELMIPREDFYRGLASSGISLTPIEMDTLMEVFAAPGRRRYVEYARFSQTVGEALTQEGLERAPLLEPVPHIPTRDTPANFLNFEERSIVSGAMQKLAKYPDQLSNLLSVFQDIDRSKCGSIPRAQVERALCTRNLLHLLSPRERELVYRCFGYKRGCGLEVNYRGLCNAIDLLHATSRGQPC